MALDCLEVMGNWVGYNRRQVIRGDHSSLSQTQSFENVGHVARFSTVLGEKKESGRLDAWGWVIFRSYFSNS